jgi:hypothetical protein
MDHAVTEPSDLPVGVSSAAGSARAERHEGRRRCLLDQVACEVAPDAAQCLGEALACSQASVQVHHHRHDSVVVQRDHAGDDPGRTQRQQAADQPEQFIGSGRGQDTGIAARENQPVRRAV